MMKVDEIKAVLELLESGRIDTGVKALATLIKGTESEPTLSLRYDLSAAETEKEIRNKLISLGWTPPEKLQQPAPRLYPLAWEVLVDLDSRYTTNTRAGRILAYRELERMHGITGDKP